MAIMSILALADANSDSPFPSKSDDPWVSLGVSVLMMFVTEIGDKTFIIAAVFGSLKERLAAILAAESTIALMVLVSVTAGDVASDIAGAGWVNISAIACYVLFGVMFLRDAWYCSHVSEVDVGQGLMDDRMPLEPLASGNSGKASKLEEWLDVFWKVAVCTFFSEWGDRTQFSAYHLSLDYKKESVVLGCLLGQALCTVIAVLGGRYITKRMSQRRTMAVGGLVFLMLAAYVFLWNPSRKFVNSK